MAFPRCTHSHRRACGRALVDGDRRIRGCSRTSQRSTAILKEASAIAPHVNASSARSPATFEGALLLDGRRFKSRRALSSAESAGVLHSRSASRSPAAGLLLTSGRDESAGRHVAVHAIIGTMLLAFAPAAG